MLVNVLCAVGGIIAGFLISNQSIKQNELDIWKNAYNEGHQDAIHKCRAILEKYNPNGSDCSWK